MTQQLSLPSIIDTDLVNAIRAEMGVYAAVALAEGTFHRPWGNINRPDRNGRSHVHGLVTRCGLHIAAETPVGPHWGTISLDIAASLAPACDACFESVRARQ